MKTKKYHFDKRWVLRDEQGRFLRLGGAMDKDIMQAYFYSRKQKAREDAAEFVRHILEVVCIKETVYVIEV